MPKVADVLAALEEKYPLARAEKWDKVGLQIGDENAPVARVLAAHEITEETLREADGCDAIVVYHPLIFRALENLDFRDHTARLAARCIEMKIAMIAIHTALDNAPPPRALGDFLAREIGLENVSVLAPSGKEALCKIAVFVPETHMETVQNAMFQSGAGAIGNYDEASFRVSGTGTFRPLEGANPFEGEVGKREEVGEFRLEMLAKESQSAEIVRAMKAAHPYEEVAHDIVPLRNSGGAFGSARVGELAASTRIEDFADNVKTALRAPNVRIVEAKSDVRKVACVPGAGASFIEAAARAGCDCLVTGDIKHHDALKARALNLSLIDATHVATERAAVSLLADAMRVLADVEIIESARDTNPFSRF